MFNGGAPGLGGAPVTKALLLAVGGASLALRIRSSGGGASGAYAAAGPLSRSLGFSTAGELIFATALMYQSRAAERAVGPAAAASGAALGGIGGAALAALARTLLSALFGRRASGGGGKGGAKAAAAALGPYPLVFALLVPLVLDVPATTSIVLAGPSSSSSSDSPRQSSSTPAANAANDSTSASTSPSSSSSSSSSRGIKITDKHFLYFEAAQLLLIGGRRSWLSALSGVAAGAAVRFDVAGLGLLRFPPLVSAAAARLLGPLLGWAPIKECIVLPSAANASRGFRQAGGAGAGSVYGLGVAGRAPPPPPPPGGAAAVAEPPAAAVAQLVAMGFSEPDARAALRRRGGNVSAALSDLLG